jgi:plastocyanin
MREPYRCVRTLRNPGRPSARTATVDHRHTRRARALTTGAISLLLILGPVSSAQADTMRVRGIFNGSSYVWRPKTRSIAAGTTVKWKAVDGNHTIQSRGSNWDYFRSLPAGTSVSRTFNNAGTFRYYCTIHGSVSNGTCSGMCGRVVVS